MLVKINVLGHSLFLNLTKKHVFMHVSLYYMPCFFTTHEAQFISQVNFSSINFSKYSGRGKLGKIMMRFLYFDVVVLGVVG